VLVLPSRALASSILPFLFSALFSPLSNDLTVTSLISSKTLLHSYSKHLCAPEVTLLVASPSSFSHSIHSSFTAQTHPALQIRSRHVRLVISAENKVNSTNLVLTEENWTHWGELTLLIRIVKCKHWRGVEVNMIQMNLIQTKF
jgi:hypothetical protein